MLERRRILLLCIISAMILTGCKVGTSSLFIHPREQGYEYVVTYNVLGGHINQMKKRTVYYAEDSLVFMPSGNSGMLVEPRNGNKTLLGWYTAVDEVREGDRVRYRFREEDRWNFERMRINEKTAKNHELVLYARWGENPKIRFVENAADQKPYVTWTVDIGAVLKRPTSTEPVKANSTLVDYYADENYTTKYEFDHIVSEDLIQYDQEQNAYINIYCKFIEGDYIRIKTVDQLKEISKNPDGCYLLANDLDLGKENWVPFEEFCGVFDGNGYCLKNMKISVKNRVSGIAAKKAKVKGYGLFEKLSNASVSNLIIQDAVINLDHSSNVAVSVGVVAGIAINSELKQIHMVNNKITSDEELMIDLIISKLAPCEGTTKLNHCDTSGTTIDPIKTKGYIELLDN